MIESLPSQIDSVAIPPSLQTPNPTQPSDPQSNSLSTLASIETNPLVKLQFNPSSYTHDSDHSSSTEFSTYKEISRFFRVIKHDNLVNSLKYAGINIEPIYLDKRDMIIEALLIVIQQLAVEDFVFFMDQQCLEFLLEGINIPPSSSSKDPERFLEYLLDKGLLEYLEECKFAHLKKICEMLNIYIDGFAEEGDTDGSFGNPDPRAKAKYVHRIMDELTLRGFRALMFEQSLALSREWVRDIGGPVAGSKQVVVERVLTAMLGIAGPGELSKDRNSYQNDIAAKLREKYDENQKRKKKSSTGSAPGSPGSQKKSKQKPKKPNPYDYPQVTEVNGKIREPILPGVSESTLLNDYTHHELRKYCSAYRLSQAGKKTELVARILKLLSGYAEGGSASEAKSDANSSAEARTGTPQRPAKRKRLTTDSSSDEETPGKKRKIEPLANQDESTASEEDQPSEPPSRRTSKRPQSFRTRIRNHLFDDETEDDADPNADPDEDFELYELEDNFH